MSAKNNVCVHASEDDSEEESPAAAEESLYSWTGPFLVRLVGDFAMMGPLTGLTGG